MNKLKELQELGGYIIIKNYFEQYALGITGAHRINTIITNDGMTFKYKKDAVKFAKENNIKNKSKKGQENEGYGSLGAMSLTVTFMRASELGENQRYYTVI